MIYRKTGIVSGSMCDGATKLSPLALLQLEEDAVTELMGELRIDGLTAMREYKAMWVFVKNTVRVFRRPVWREAYELRSFVSAHSAAKLLIDTELRSPASAVPIFHARLELCALDLETGRIRKAASVGVTDGLACEEALPGLAFTRFPKGSAAPLERVTVRSTNLDYCSHTNNVEYLRFILNTYRAETFLQKEIAQLELHYGNQTFEGDEIEVLRFEEADRAYFTLEAHGSTAAECMIRWA